MALLYADLNPADASKITARLDQLNVPYRLRGDGTEILVPVDAVPKARITLAGEGLPAGGSLGYEIFDKSQGLATSSFVPEHQSGPGARGRIGPYPDRDRETCAAPGSTWCCPRRELFSRDRQAPSASIMLRMAGAKRLEKAQVVAIQHIVAAAVPGLKPERISIVDEHGTLLGARQRPEQPGRDAADRRGDAHRLREPGGARAVEALLERSLGYGKGARRGQRRHRLRPDHGEPGDLRSERQGRDPALDPDGQRERRAEARATRTRR